MHIVYFTIGKDEQYEVHFVASAAFSMFSRFLDNWSKVGRSKELNFVDCVSVCLQHVLDAFDLFTSFVQWETVNNVMLTNWAPSEAIEWIPLV